MNKKYLKKRIFFSLCDYLLRKISREWLLEVFYKIGNKLGIVSCSVDGTLGEYQAKFSDQVILKQYILTGTWSPAIQGYLNKLASNKIKTYIDIGANVGLTLIPIKQSFPEISVFGIEADKQNFEYLRHNIEKSLDSQATIFNCAAYSADAELEFEVSERNAGDNRIKGHNNSMSEYYEESKRKTIVVKARKVDNLLDINSLEKPIGIKCDIQGGEIEFFKGAEGLLSDASWMLAEYWPYGLSRANSNVEEYLSIISIHFPYGQILDENFDLSEELLDLESLTRKIENNFKEKSLTAHCDLIFSKQKFLLNN